MGIAPGEGAWRVKNIVRMEMDETCGTRHNISVRAFENGWKVKAVCLTNETGIKTTEGILRPEDPESARRLTESWEKFILGG